MMADSEDQVDEGLAQAVNEEVLAALAPSTIAAAAAAALGPSIVPSTVSTAPTPPPGKTVKHTRDFVW